MRVRVQPGGTLRGEVRVPGDKSIAHRWLMLAATGLGPSALVDLPGSLDVRSTGACLAAVAGQGRAALEAWASNDPSGAEGHGSTWNVRVPGSAIPPLEVDGEGRAGLRAPEEPLDCGNSGTTMRLLAGVLAAAPFPSVLTGDESLRRRPMERVADPLRAMGAAVRTEDGHAPIRIDGGALTGVTVALSAPSAQVKSAVLLAGLAAEGTTTVVEPSSTRDHTERAIRALGGPVVVEGSSITVSRFQHAGFAGTVPGDPSSAAFVVAAAAMTGSEVTIEGVGLNPSRLRFLDVLSRMGVRTERRIEREEMGEPVGSLWVAPCEGIRPVRVEGPELPLVIDEVPVLALLAQHAGGDSWFLDAGELRVKESDRLSGIARAIGSLGGHAAVEGDDLVVAGGGLAGGRGDSEGDHRMAMAMVVAGLAAAGPVEVDGAEAADVSFPGFLATMAALGAGVEAAG